MIVQQLWGKSCRELMSKNFVIGKMTLCKKYNYREVQIRLTDYQRLKPHSWIGYNVSFLFSLA